MSEARAELWMRSSDARWQAISERYQRREAEIHAPLTDENMAACVEEIAAVFRRRGITADCWLDSPTASIRARVQYPPEAS